MIFRARGNRNYNAAGDAGAFLLKAPGALFFFIPFFFLLFIPPQITAAAGPSAVSGKRAAGIYGINSSAYTIKSVKYSFPPGVSAKKLQGLIYIKAGQKFSMLLVEKTIKSLYETGYFSNIRVFSTVDDKRKLIYVNLVFNPMKTVGAISIKMPLSTGVTEQEILSSLPFSTGGKFFKNYAKTAEKNVKKVFSKAGYPDASVTASYSAIKKTPRYAVKISIKPGAPIIVSNVFVTLEVFYPKKEIKSYVKEIEGKPLNALSLRLLRGKIWKLYLKAGYLNAFVSPPAIKYISKYRAVVSYSVRPGYKILFNFKGISPLKPSFVKYSIFNINNVLIFNGETFDSFRSALEEYLKTEGYHFASVSLKVEKNKKTSTVNVYYAAVKGPRVRIAKIEIKGEEPVTKSFVLSLMKTSVSSFFSPRYYFKKELLRDMSNIQNYYGNRGWLGAAVKYSVAFSSDKKNAFISLRVIKGVRTYVKTVDVTGLPPGLEKKLIPAVTSMSGKPLYIINAQDEKQFISTALADSGYVFSRTTLDITYSKDKSYAYLKYTVSSGPMVTIGNITVAGNTVTKTSYIRSLLLFKKGQVYDQAKIIETQDRLFRAGIFNYVQIRLANPKSVKTVKNIIIEVKDAKPFSLSFGAGYGTYTRYRGFIQVQDSNLFGSGKSLSLILAKSAVYTNLVLDYYDRSILNYRGLSFNAQALDTDLVTLNYTIHEEGTRFSLIRQFNNSLKGLISYGMYFDNLSGLNPGAQITPRDTGFTRISEVSAEGIFNSKNNPFNPTSGNLTTLKATYSAFALDSQLHFFRAVFHTTEYIPIIDGTVFLFSLRAGYIRPLAPTTQVPINERFFLGGRTTVRGFPEDSIGLVNLNPYHYPIGGDVMENYNLQMNFPVYNKDIDFFIFQDGGNVFLRIQDVRPFSLFKSAGAGISYLSPIGPISFSYGFILTRKPYWPAGGFNFTIGTSF